MTGSRGDGEGKGDERKSGVTDRATTPPEGSYSEQLRETILEATSRIVEDEGVQAATPTRIFAATGIARSTIYRYWPDKVELLDEALRRRSKSKQGLAARTGLSDFERIIRHTVESFQEDAFVRMLATTLGHTDVGDEDANAKWRKLASDLANSRSQEFRQCLHRAEVEGRILGDLRIAEIAALTLGPCLYLRLLSGRPLSESFVEQIVALARSLVAESEAKPLSGRKRNA